MKRPLHLLALGSLLLALGLLPACSTAPVPPPAYAPLRADVATARAHPQARLVARDYPDFYRTVLTLLAKANSRENQP